MRLLITIARCLFYNVGFLGSQKTFLFTKPHTGGSKNVVTLEPKNKISNRKNHWIKPIMKICSSSIGQSNPTNLQSGCLQWFGFLPDSRPPFRIPTSMRPVCHSDPAAARAAEMGNTLAPVVAKWRPNSKIFMQQRLQRQWLPATNGQPRYSGPESKASSPIPISGETDSMVRWFWSGFVSNQIIFVKNV